ncbi:unnamed protein product [Amoebophrya sp. A120]|nr:unnamed protein product [Amoebophrya sp. A120]|eukprot:GSA120T00018409001.1
MAAAPEARVSTSGNGTSTSSSSSAPLMGIPTDFVLDRNFFMKYLRKDWKKEFQGSAETKSGRQAQLADFDIYIGETLAPLLALALEQLTKIIHQRHQRKDASPTLYYRFNPCNWIGQFLVRKKTNFLYQAKKENSFADWADFEKGRREMLRKKGQMQKVFAGFQKGGKVLVDEMPRLIAAIDETLQVEGYLRDHEIIPKKWNIIEDEGGTTNFQSFWKWFARKVLAEDLMRYSKLKVGELKILEQERQAQALLEAKRLREEEEARKRKWRKTFESYIERIKDDVYLSKLLTNKTMMLTGEEYEDEEEEKPDELPPSGPHVALLRELLDFLGIQPDQRMELIALDAKTHVNEAFEENAEAWNITAQLAWELWQAYLKLMLIDGVVDQYSLTKLCELDVQAAMAISERVPELKIRRLAIRAGELVEDADEGVAAEEEQPKPPMNDLCIMYGLTMARIEWLHTQFKSFLPEGMEDDYPEDPAGMSKDVMRKLMYDLLPGLGEEEFEQKFTEIDLDGGGQIEFDEFVEWLSKETIDLEINAADVAKPSFEQLAKRHDKSLEKIMEIYAQFKGFLPEDQECNYPDEPAHLTKEIIRKIFTERYPDCDDEEFEDRYGLVDFDGGGEIEFDEYLDFGFDNEDEEEDE